MVFWEYGKTFLRQGKVGGVTFTRTLHYATTGDPIHFQRSQLDFFFLPWTLGGTSHCLKYDAAPSAFSYFHSAT